MEAIANVVERAKAFWKWWQTTDPLHRTHLEKTGVNIIGGLLAEITRLESELAKARLTISGRTFTDERQAAAMECAKLAETWQLGEDAFGVAVYADDIAAAIKQKFHL